MAQAERELADSFKVAQRAVSRARDPKDSRAPGKLTNKKENPDTTGHPKWKSSFVRSALGNMGYGPTTDIIQIFNILDSNGYRIIKK